MQQSTPECNRQMWRTTRTICAIAAALFFLATVILVLKGQSITQHLSVTVFSAFLWFAMRKERPEVSISVPIVIFLVLVALGQLSMWTNNELMIHNEKVFEIFTGERITALVIGLIAPPFNGWAG